MPEKPLPTPFVVVDEAQPGSALRALFDRFWPSYRRWFMREGERARPTYAEGVRSLRAHMPELFPTYERLCELVGGGDHEARFLSLWRPTPFLTGCSQAIWLGEPLALIRNYDYAAHLHEATILCSAWHDTPTIAMTDCLWGALDGMNGHGLAVALAFGGRKVVGDGFAIPLIVRYVLEFCRDVDDAVDALRRVPSHMAYNVSLVDRTGAHATVFLAPDRPADVTDALVCANHQRTVEWPEHATLTATVERERFLVERLADPEETFDRVFDRFLEPPVHLTGRFRQWRTLYTVAYLPQREQAIFRWPGTAVELAVHPGAASA